MTRLEKEIEKKLIKMVKRHGGFCVKWVCPGWSGVPDRIILLPGAQVYFVETKRPEDGRLSALQRKWQEWLTELGFHACVVWSEVDVVSLEQLIISRKESGR